MRNPWLAKNPFLSLWMSGASRVLGTARGHALNEVRRQQKAMIGGSANAILAFWSGAARGRPAKKNGRRS